MTRAAGRNGGVRSDDGSAVVDFVLVSALLTLLFASVLQLGLAMHVRATLTDAAAEGARYAARADRTPADGIGRTRAIASASLSPRFVGDVTAGREVRGGVQVVVVRVSAPLPVLGLLGPRDGLRVTGHAYAEDQ